MIHAQIVADVADAEPHLHLALLAGEVQAAAFGAESGVLARYEREVCTGGR